MGGRKCSRCQKEMRPTMFASFEWQKSVEVRLCKICLPGSVPPKPRSQSRSRSRSKTPAKASSAPIKSSSSNEPSKASSPASPVRNTSRGRSKSRSTTASVPVASVSPAKSVSTSPTRSTSTPPAKVDNFYLEKWCKDAGAAELSPSNTGDHAFYGMAVIAPLLLFGLCYYLTGYQLNHLWIKVLSMCIATHLYGYIVSEMLQTNKWFDAIEDISFSGILLYVYNDIKNPTFAQTLLFTMAGLWVMRLTIFLSYRAIVSTGDDFRFEALMKNRSYNVFGWTMGGCWCFIQGLCLWVIADQCSKRKSPLNISTYGNEFSNLSVGTYIGIGVFVIGLAMESIADFQKSNKEMKNSFIDTGLWSLCRHPNYLGENLVWIGMSITAMASLDNSCCASTYSRKLWLCAMSAIWSSFFLFNTSLMMLEKRADEKFKNSTAYKEYKAKTPILLPIHV